MGKTSILFMQVTGRNDLKDHNHNNENGRVKQNLESFYFVYKMQIHIYLPN
jgi:hypothetical protein